MRLDPRNAHAPTMRGVAAELWRDQQRDHTTIGDSGMAAPAVLDHCASVIDAAVAVLCEGHEVSTAGRKVLAHVAGRVRHVARVIA